MTVKTFGSEEQRLTKNKKIAETRKKTRDRRSQMQCQVFQLKIITNNASKKAQNDLKQVFNQAKWVKNHIISLPKVDDYKSSKTVEVKTPNGYEQRELNLLGSQVKQSIYDQIKSDIKALSASKSKGRKVGKLKFVREIRSLNLKQVNSTYRFNKRMNRVKIQGLPNWYYVCGKDQFKNLKNYEFANAKLLKKADGYYIAVTVYSNKRINEKKLFEHNYLGVDFGVKTHFTLSDGSEYNIKVVETERLRRLSKKLSRQKKGSNNFNKTRVLIQKEYQKIFNFKEEAANKFVSQLSKKAEFVYFQDDNFNPWKNKKSLAHGGRTIQHGILGRVKNKMMKNPEKFLRVNRFEPTSKTCVCGVVNNELSLKDRWFVCDSCGYSAPRDVHAANNMMRFYSPAERGGVLVEKIQDPKIGLFSMKQETDNFINK